MDMSKVDNDIKTLLSEGKEPVLLVGEDTLRDLIGNGRVVRRVGFPVRYNGAKVILNACNPDKCEVVVKE